MKLSRTLIAATVAAIIAGSVVARAAMTNYLGTVFIGDSTAPANQLKVNSDGSLSAAPPGVNKATYSAAFDVTGYATPTDLWAIGGSASKTIKINRISVNGQATTSTQVDLLLVKRSTANTGGTPTSITLVPMDSADAAASATVVSYAAAPVLGTLVGSVRDSQATLPPPTSSTPSLTYLLWDFGTRNDKPLILHGTAEMVALNFQGAALPAGMKLSIDIEWTEE